MEWQLEKKNLATLVGIYRLWMYKQRTESGTAYIISVATLEISDSQFHSPQPNGS